MINPFALSILVLSLVSLSSAVIELGGQSGKDTLASIETGTGLWNWGSVPFGHVVDDDELIAGAAIDPLDMSTMETPLQALGMDKAGSIAPLLSSGSVCMSSSDQKPFKSAPGVFDCTVFFEAPSPGQFPRIY